jgi:hypothetical protein
MTMATFPVFGRWRRGALAPALVGAALVLLGSQACAETEAVIPGAYTEPAGRAEPTKTVPDFPVWKRITLGTHKGVNAVRDALDAHNIRVGESADEILGRPAFRFSKTRTPLDLVVLTALDLGFAKGSWSLAEIYRRAAQLGLELCPAEAAPQLRLEYLNQPIGEFLHIAMPPVATYGGDLVDLTVGNGGAGLILIGGDGSPDLKLHSSVKFVFVRPTRIALPNNP